MYLALNSLLKKMSITSKSLAKSGLKLMQILTPI